jgi:streptogramin lyase
MRRLPVRSLLVVFFCMLVVTASTLDAQAVFSSAQSIVAKGLAGPGGVAVDESGNVYVADTSNNRVLMETLSNGSYTQSTIVSGLGAPNAVAVDSAGNVYISDRANSRVLKETLSNGSYTQSTVVSGLITPSGVAVDASGDLYVVDEGSNQVFKETLSAGVYTQSVVANGLTAPLGVAVDVAGNVYVSESGEVLKETLAAGAYTQSTLASGLSTPYGVAVDGSGNVYIAAQSSNQVFKETLASGSYTQSVVPTIGLSSPRGIAVDLNGDLYITNAGTGQVIEESVTNGNLGSVNVGATSPSPISVIFTFTAATTLGSTSVVTQGAKGLDFSDAGTGSCTPGTAYNAGDSCSVDARLTPKYAGTRYGAADLLDTSGNLLATGYLQGNGVGPQVAFLPGTSQTAFYSSTTPYQGAAVEADGTVYVIVATESEWQVLKFAPTATGYTQSTVVEQSLYSMVFTTLAVDPSGIVYVCCDDHNGILKETPAASAYVETRIDNLVLPSDVKNSFEYFAVDGSGNIYIVADPSESSEGIVAKETLSNGRYTLSAVITTLDPLVGVAADGNGNVYVITNYGNIHKETLSAGRYTDSVVFSNYGSSIFALDGRGNVFLTPDGYHIVMLTPAAAGYIQNTIASCDCSLNWIGVDGGGVVYTTDIEAFGFSRLSKIHLDTPPRLSFDPTVVGSTSSDSPQTAPLENLGNAPLIFPVPTAGDNPSISANFTLNSSIDSACPLVTASGKAGSLPAYAGCLLSISFTPETAGSPLTGTLDLTDNTANAAAPHYATQSIRLSGTGGSPTPASITAPAPGSTFTGPVETFVWTLGIGVTAYELRIGTTAGSNNVYDSGSTTATSEIVSGIPTASGAKIYVSLVSTFTGGSTQTANYAFIEATAVSASLTSPTPGSTLDGSSVTFAWTVGLGVTTYELRLGTAGVGSNNLYDSGSTKAKSVSVSNIPTDSATVFVQLLSSFNGSPTQAANYTYAEATPSPAMLTSPTPGSTLGSYNVSFAWTAGSFVTSYEIRVGTAGIGSSNIFDRFGASPLTVNFIPTSGGTLYVALLSYFNGAPTQTVNYTFTEATSKPAALTFPTDRTLAGSSVTFTWSTGNLVSDYELWVGTTEASSSNIYRSAWTTATSATVSNIPTSGGTAFVRLYSKINGAAKFTDYTFTESGGPALKAALTAPTVSTLSGSGQTFTWSAGAGVSKYGLRIGTTSPGSDDIYNAFPTTALTASVSGIPTSGATLYVRLYSNIDQAWQFTDYTFTEAGGPPVAAVLTAPTGTALSGSGQTFTWTAGVGVTEYELWVGTTNQSSSNIYQSGWTTSTSATVNNIPTTGGKVYVRLCSRIDGAWQFTDYVFTESVTAVAGK